MSHVTEGQLHAYLDGALGHEAPEDAEALEAHLRTCGDCRARLEAAERLRDRTSQILAGAALDPTGLPAFEEILRRAEQERPVTPEDDFGKIAGGRRPGVRLGSLAWAASVLLAVGLGWAARTYSVAGGSDDRVARLEAPARGAVDEAAARTSEGEAATRAKELPEKSQTLRLDKLADTKQPPPRDQIGAVATAEKSEVAGAATEQDRIEDKRADTDEARQAQRSLATPSVARAELEEMQRPEDEVWVATDDDTAERWIGGKPLRVEGLPVLDVSISTREGARVIRSRQLLASGQLVEVYQARPGLAEGRKVSKKPAAAGPQEFRDTGRVLAGRAAAGQRENRITLQGRMAGFEVELVAPVAWDSLRVLLSQLH